MKLLLATENGAQELRVKVREKGYYATFLHMRSVFDVVQLQGGTQQISEILADRVGRERIHLGEPVTSISHEEGEIVTVRTLSGKFYRQLKCR